MAHQHVRFNANVHVPTPVNEPVLDYTPGSTEAIALREELDRVGKQTRELSHVIGGERVSGGERRTGVSPHDHTNTLSTIPVVRDADVSSAIDAALDARSRWSRTPWWERASVFLRAAELVTGKYRNELMATTMLGQSKTFHQAEIDAACELADFLRYNVHFAGIIYEEQPPSAAGQSAIHDHRALEGFLLAITPFNFTAIAGNLPSTQALMGNTVVWKPSEKSALSSDVVMRVFEEAGLPPGVINLVHGDGQAVASRAIAHEQFAGLSFTGSTNVFRSLWAETATHIGQYRSYPRLVGETGGKNAVVAHPSADLEALLTALVRGAFEYQGQKCSAASRAYIPRSLWRQLEGRLVEAVQEIRTDDPTKHETFVGAVIDRTALERLESAIARANSLDSHRLLVGGTVRPEVGWFVDPTVFVTDDPTAFTMTEEFFGPLLTVYVYEDKDWETVLPLVDGTGPYGLTCSIFATSNVAISQALDVLRDTAGMVCVNDKPTGAVIGLHSFGGGRASGTNDKIGSPAALRRWVSGRLIKENLRPAVDWTYPYMGTQR
jgi:1-pyrroline-5-carboxylate dehydrogenase